VSIEGQTQPGRPTLDVVALPLEGVHLIEASAGTGKTYNIAALFLRLIIEAELPIEQILAVTFTKMATSELRDRVERRLVEARDMVVGDREPADPVLAAILLRVQKSDAKLLLERALSDIDRASIFTIHGFAARAIGDAAFEAHASFSAEVLPDTDRLAYDAVVDFWSTRVRSLSAEAFARLGGLGLFGELEKVAKTALVNVEVPTVSLEPVPESKQKEIEEKVRSAAEVLRAEFEPETVRALLDSGRVKRNVVRPEFVEKALREWEAFLAGDPLLSLPPKNWAKFCQSFVSAQTAKGKEPVQHGFFVAVERFRDAYEELERVDALSRARLYDACAQFVRQRVQGEHLRQGTKSFDDLLLVLRDALVGPAGPALKSSLARRFRAALIDEFQDTDPLQYQVFREIFAERERPSLFLIGDPKQSIYGFRGADVLSYLKAAESAGSSLHSLTTSYRASPRLVEAQNAIFSLSSNPFLLERIVYDWISPAPGRKDELLDEAGQKLAGVDVVVVREGGSTLAQAALEVHALLTSHLSLRGRPISARNVAVLCRKNSDAQEVQEHLRALGIPAVMHGDRSVFESPEAIEVRRVLRALLDPGHRTLVRAALATRIFGLGAAGISELDEHPEKLELWDSRLRRWSDTWRVSGFFRMMDSVLRELSVVPRLLRSWGGERIVTNLRHIIELLHQAEAEEHLGALGLVRYLESCIQDPFGHAMAEAALQIRLESDEDAVVLTTIHKSKGLEYDVVVLPSLGNPDEPWKEPAFRTRNRDGDPELEVRSPELAADSYDVRLKEHQAEALRVGYVALTRARHHTIVVLGKHTTKFSPLAYWLRDEGPFKALPSNWEGPLSRVVARGAGSIRVRPPSPPNPRPLQVSEHRYGPLALPELSPDLAERLGRGLTTASFSSLTRSRGSRGTSALLGRDRDETESETSVVASEARGEHARLHDFPRGALAGEALHAIFERLVWVKKRKLDETSVGEILRSHDIDPGFAPRVTELVEGFLTTPLGPDRAELGTLPPASVAAELEFHLALAPRDEGLTAAELTRVLRSLSCLPVSYREGNLSLEFPVLRGFLRGFIDLVFEWRGKVYVLDYKSNFLGERLADYDRPAMERAMNEHHYHLQGLIYALAVMKQARLLRKDYAHDLNFGGIFYVFLRGLAGPETDTGVYFFRPSEEEMRAFEAALIGT
jgi:exodeoxyribonuclease V beta subunit